MMSKLKSSEAVLTLCLLLPAACLLLLTFGKSLFFLDFTDETEKYVGAQMLYHGMHLYRDIFSHHGPFLHMITHWYAELISPTNFSYARVMVLLFAAAAGLSIYTSPALETRNSRLAALGLFLLMLAPLWLLNMQHMLLYHQIGGYLFVIAMSQMALPALLNKPLSKIGVFCSIFCISMACYTAYSFGLSALLVTGAALLAFSPTTQTWRPLLLPALLGALVATAIIFLWLYLNGDILGYYVHHFYFNQNVYANVISFSLSDIVRYFQWSGRSGSGLRLLSMAILLVASCALVLQIMRRQDQGGTHSTWSHLRKWLAVAALILAIFYMNPRASAGFHDNGFIVLSIALFAMMAGLCVARLQLSLRYYVVGCLFAVIAGATATSVLLSKTQERRKHNPVAFRPIDTPMTQFIREATGEDGRILSLIFQPTLYLHANRLPASGHYYYLPWQATYSRDPYMGYKIDLCGDIQTNQPAIIKFDDWAVWGKYSIGDYEPCFTKLLQQQYRPHPEYQQIFVRNDVAIP